MHETDALLARRRDETGFGKHLADTLKGFLRDAIPLENVDGAGELFSGHGDSEKVFLHRALGGGNAASDEKAEHGIGIALGDIRVKILASAAAEGNHSDENQRAVHPGFQHPGKGAFVERIRLGHFLLAGFEAGLGLGGRVGNSATGRSRAISSSIASDSSVAG